MASDLWSNFQVVGQMPDEEEAPPPPATAAAPAPSPAAPPPSGLEATLRGAKQGATMNWGNYLGAVGRASPTMSAVESVPSPLDLAVGGGRLLGEKYAPSLFGTAGHSAYQKALEEAQAKDEAASTAHPYLYGGGELGGGALPAALATAAFPEIAGAGLASRALQASKGGAVVGGISGAGAAPDAASVPGQALEGAAIGGVAAPVVGGALQAAGKGIGWAGGKIAGLFSSPLPKDAAESEIAARLAAAGIKPEDVQAQMEAMNKAGVQNYTMADAANEATAPLIKQIGATPATRVAAQDEFPAIVKDRANDLVASGRSDAAVKDLLGTDGTLATQTALTARQKALADPLYEAARTEPVDTTTEGFRNSGGTGVPLMERLQATGVISQAAHEAKIEGVPFSVGLDPSDPIATIDSFDAVKQALDAQISKAADPTKPNNKRVRILVGLKSDLTKELDAQSDAIAGGGAGSGNYPQARAVWSGQERMKDALDAGANAFKNGYSREQVASDMANFQTPGEQTMYRLGAGNKLREDMANQGPQAFAEKFQSQQGARDKVEALSEDPQSFDNFSKRMQAETEMAKTAKDFGTSGQFPGDKPGFFSPWRTMRAGTSAAAAAVGHVTPGLHLLGELAAESGVKSVNSQSRQAILQEAKKLIFSPDPEDVRIFAEKMRAKNVSPRLISKFMALAPDTHQVLQSALPAVTSGLAPSPSQPIQNQGPSSVHMIEADNAMHLNPQEKALYQRHLTNLNGPGGVDNPNGSRSTLFQANVEVNGKNYNIPTVYDGKILTPKDALARAKAQGIDTFPSYPDEDTAEARYQQMHQYMEKDTGDYMAQRNAARKTPQTIGVTWRAAKNPKTGQTILHNPDTGEIRQQGQ